MDGANGDVEEMNENRKIKQKRSNMRLSIIT